MKHTLVARVADQPGVLNRLITSPVSIRLPASSGP